MNLLVAAWEIVSGKKIEKFFKHVGFKSNDDYESENSDQSGIPEIELERFFSIDNEVATAPSVDDDDIVNGLVEDACASSYEDEFVEDNVISKGTALLHLQQLKDYLCRNGSSYWSTFCTIKDFSYRPPCCITQTTITSYFCN